MALKLRVLSAVLVGLGVALIVGGLLAPRIVLIDGRLPLNLSNRTWTVVDEDGWAASLVRPEEAPYEGELKHQTHLDLLEPADTNSVAVRVGTSWNRGSRDAGLIAAQTYSYRIDRAGGQALEPATLAHTPGTPPSTVDMPGYWLKLPLNAEGTSYDLYDDVLRAAFPATQVDTTEMQGRRVDHYHQKIEPTNVAQLYAGPFNTRSIPGPDGQSERLFLYHSADRDVYVDHITGIVVKIEETVDQYYGRVDGSRVQDVLRFDGVMRPEQTEAMLTELDEHVGAAKVRVWLWSAVGVGGVLLILGLVAASLAAGTGRHRGARSRR